MEPSVKSFINPYYRAGQTPAPAYSPALHLICLLTAAVTFPLIFLGGLVTSHHAGMSVPDWPNSYGYNMFLFPPRDWVGGILYEHTHRLLASGIGMMTIAVCVMTFFIDARRWVKWLAAGMLGFVILQGVLGGLRVVFNNLNLAVVHGCVAQAFFCYAALMCMVTSRWWICGAGWTAPEPGEQIGDPRATPLASQRLPRIGPGLRRLAVIATLAIYGQLIIGACMRHWNAGLAIPDVPLAYGHWLPPTTVQELHQINHQRAWAPTPPGRAALGPVTLGQIWIHYAHRVGAVAVSALLIGLMILIAMRYRRRRELALPALALAFLLVAQITLGVLTVLLRKPADVATAHVACGALTLMTTFVIAARSWRLWAVNNPRRVLKAAPATPLAAGLATV
jgi:cytochrome c oxidase assembly protein subunit 15